MISAYEYFRILDSWTNRHFKNPKKDLASRIRLSESVTMGQFAKFSIIELSLIAPNK